MSQATNPRRARGQLASAAPPAAEFAGSAHSPAQFPRDRLPEVALVGRSNVGKSSLLNRLAGARRLAAVSRTPGRTQQVNFFRLGGRFYLVDLPGYGFARAPYRVRRLWEGLVASYLFGREPLRLVLLLVDARHEPMPSDFEARDLLLRGGTPLVLVATKSDKLSASALRLKLAGIERGLGESGSFPVIAFSAVTGEGRKELWNVIEKHALGANRTR
jgi:GTP-binding protein